MCGIAGEIDFSTRPRAENLAPVLDLLTHRGPDDRGLWSRGPAVLGHTRLAILDLSPTGRQPMVDPDTGTAIVFNGEIYNFQALRKSLKHTGYPFQSSGDTEVILALYRRYGKEAISRLRGMFALAVWDPNREELLLARDRMGQKPLFYFRCDNRLVFASELRALAAHPDLNPAISDYAVDLFFSLEYIPAPLSIYQDVLKLLPGHLAVFSRQGWHEEQYWSLDYRKKKTMDETQALESLDAALDEAVVLRMQSHVPFGALLSGGVDSSLVVAAMTRHMDRPPQTFSIGFAEKKFDETQHARRVAELLGTEHHQEIMPPASLELLSPLLAGFGEPFADNASLATFFLCRLARTRVVVALGGDGGDELLCGYPTYTKTRAAEFLAKFHPPQAHGTEKLSRLMHDPGTWAKLRRPLLFHWTQPELKPLLRNEPRIIPLKNRLFSPDFRRATRDGFFNWYDMWYRQSFAHADNTVERMLWIDNHTFLPDQLLVKTDIASMAHSLEVRCPFLDHKLIEVCAAFPPELKVRGRITKYILKKLGARSLPQDLMHRRKQGFSMPVDSWLRGPMAEFMMQSFDRTRNLLQDYLNMNVLRTLAQEHIKGRQNHTGILWKTLNFALWHQNRPHV